jgi:DNA invertase Pin-like site-specific DNA recombinase
VALYARVSTKDKQEIESQLIDLREYCQRTGWEIIDEYIDKETGGTSKRKDFQRMFVDARARKFDLVLFWSLDRFSREGVLETLNHLQRLTSYGVDWRSHKEDFLDSTGPLRDAVIAILACLARQERVRRSERAIMGVAKARRNGTQLGRPCKIVPRDRVRELHKQGLGVRAIAKKLGGMSFMTVHRILKRA